MYFCIIVKTIYCVSKSPSKKILFLRLLIVGLPDEASHVSPRNSHALRNQYKNLLLAKILVQSTYRKFYINSVLTSDR